MSQPLSHGPGPRAPGSTLVDALLVVALLGLILVGATRFSQLEMERAEINALAIELSGWLEAIQKASMRLPAPPGTGPEAGGCQVTFVDHPLGAAAGATIARVRLNPASRKAGGPGDAVLPDSVCHPETELRMPGTRNASAAEKPGGFVTTTLRSGSEASVIFTPRGTVTATQPLELVIRHRGDSRAARCVRVNAISGLVELGHDNSAAGAGDPSLGCPEASFLDLI
ncbi:MAG: hypothetical protein VKJ05_06370 [Synechococcaceae cyanobacterium]|nr:hypothetical protein [Synechococcaceae cyanobacterium]